MVIRITRNLPLDPRLKEKSWTKHTLEQILRLNLLQAKHFG